MCDVNRLPFADEFTRPNSCGREVKEGKVCRFTCKFDKKNRGKIPKTLKVKCQAAKDEQGEVIGVEFDYGKGGYEQFLNACGDGMLSAVLRSNQ